MSPESSSMAIILSSIILSSLQIVFVIARSLSRLLTKFPPIWGLDDHLIIVSLFLNLSLAALCPVAVYLADMGHHLLWIQPAKLVIGLKVLYAVDIINILALSIPKLAILFLYKRLFITSKLTNHAIKGATYAVYAFIIVLEAIAIFQCVPISDAFKIGPRKSRRCIDNMVVLTWATVPSIVTDIVIFLIPVPVVWKLNVSLRFKIELAVEFIIGGFGMVVCAVRVSVFLRIQHLPDVTYVGGESLLWLQLQPAAYLICACLLRCRPLLEAIIETISCRSPRMMETPVRELIPMTSVKVGTSEKDVREWSSGDKIEVSKMEKVHLG
ncbi:uncharacterized protein EAF01_009733 [Botrytis porri]|nr:uncharacterized protein EAF01_009733 [Botrytis porri]KAF7895771.1 hypothetical protein EAF01_009733 [Botrytis porri]